MRHMRKAFLHRSWLQRGVTAFAVFVLAYAILLRGLAAPSPVLPSSLQAALIDPHYFCLNDGNSEGLPAHGTASCEECCFGIMRIDALPPSTAFIISPWPRFEWSYAYLHQPTGLGGPSNEAWNRAHSQRGPPESRTPTSFT